MELHAHLLNLFRECIEKQHDRSSKTGNIMTSLSYTCKEVLELFMSEERWEKQLRVRSNDFITCTSESSTHRKFTFFFTFWLVTLLVCMGLKNWRGNTHFQMKNLVRKKCSKYPKYYVVLRGISFCGSITPLSYSYIMNAP